MAATADDLLLALAHYGIIGLTIPDVGDSTGWVFEESGEAHIDSFIRADAIAEIEALLAAVDPPTVQDELDQLRADVDSLMLAGERH